MRKSSLLLLISVLGWSSPQVAVKGPVDWLTGCWENRKGDRLIEEHWMAARGGVMLEIGRTSRGDSLVDYEFVILHLTAGHVAYEAHPAGQPTETFPAKVVTDSGVVFEDLAHDFPQRVGYDRLGADSLLGWIEGDVGGKVRRIEFPYHRTDCN